MIPFGHTMSYSNSGDVLTIVCPVDAYFNGFVLLGFLVIVITQVIRKKMPWWGWLFAAGLLAFTLNETISYSTLVFNGAANNVHVVMRNGLFRRQVRDIALSTVSGASIRNSDQSDAAQVDFYGGDSMMLSPFTQMGGKGQAVNAINMYLRTYGNRDNAQ